MTRGRACAAAAIAWLALGGCGGGGAARDGHRERTTTGAERAVEGAERGADAGADASAEAPAAPRTPCEAAPPRRDALAASTAGVLIVDAAAPGALGACVSGRALVGAPEMVEFTCDSSGERCLLGAGRVLLARAVDDACVPFAVLAYPGDVPADADAAVLLDAARALRDEGCALHDRVARGDADFFGAIDRLRRVAASGRRGALTAECLRGSDARAGAELARSRFVGAPLRCRGLRCERVEPGAGEGTGEGAGEGEGAGAAAAPANPEWLFANRVSGPLRLDAIATGPLDGVLAQLRRRCR